VRLRTVLAGLAACVATFGPALPTSAETTPTTIVSFTFEGTSSSQEAALDEMLRRHLGATLYVNSGRVGDPGFLDYLGLKHYAQHGIEIGGATIDGGDLAGLDDGEVAHQVCDGRSALVHMGFSPRSFAYPTGPVSGALERVVAACGYSSARAVGYLGSGFTAETLAPLDQMAIRSTPPESDGAFEALKEAVNRSRATGGGWLPVALPRICSGNRCPVGSMRLDQLTGFLDWLAVRRDQVAVRTVTEALAPRVVRAVPVSRMPAVTVLGVGVGQSQIVAGGLVAGLVVVISYRTATRGNRYVRAH
jgi:hypothetical protein